jgi:hypothetical protein
MDREYRPSPDSLRIIGLILAAGAASGALAGTAIGLLWGELGHWIVTGIPAGISVALAAGALLSKPAANLSRPEPSATLWAGAEDDVPRPFRSLSQR